MALVSCRQVALLQEEYSLSLRLNIRVFAGLAKLDIPPKEKKKRKKSYNIRLTILRISSSKNKQKNNNNLSSFTNPHVIQNVFFFSKEDKKMFNNVKAALLQIMKVERDWGCQGKKVINHIFL